MNPTQDQRLADRFSGLQRQFEQLTYFFRDFKPSDQRAGTRFQENEYLLTRQIKEFKGLASIIELRREAGDQVPQSLDEAIAGCATASQQAHSVYAVAGKGRRTN